MALNIPNSLRERQGTLACKCELKAEFLDIQRFLWEANNSACSEAEIVGHKDNPNAEPSAPSSIPIGAGIVHGEHRTQDWG